MRLNRNSYSCSVCNVYIYNNIILIQLIVTLENVQSLAVRDWFLHIQWLASCHRKLSKVVVLNGMFPNVRSGKIISQHIQF